MKDMSRARRAFLQGSLAFGALALLEPAVSWAANWIKLGARTLRPGKDNTVVTVTFIAGAFSHIQIGVSDGSVFVTGVEVRFSNAQHVNLPFRGRIRSGHKSRPLALPGGHRYISFVRIKHRPVQWMQRLPTIEVSGER